jgi:hypothetical protein
LNISKESTAKTLYTEVKKMISPGITLWKTNYSDVPDSVLERNSGRVHATY